MQFSVLKVHDQHTTDHAYEKNTGCIFQNRECSGVFPLQLASQELWQDALPSIIMYITIYDTDLVVSEINTVLQ